MAGHLRTELILDALDMAIARRIGWPPDCHERLLLDRLSACGGDVAGQPVQWPMIATWHLIV